MSWMTCGTRHRRCHHLATRLPCSLPWPSPCPAHSTIRQRHSFSASNKLAHLNHCHTHTHLRQRHHHRSWFILIIRQCSSLLHPGKHRLRGFVLAVAIVCAFFLLASLALLLQRLSARLLRLSYWLRLRGLVVAVVASSSAFLRHFFSQLKIGRASCRESVGQ